MLDNRARELKETLFAPVAQLLGRWPPAAMTAVSLLLGILCALFIWQQNYLLGVIFWFLNRITDGLDGAIARLHDKQSDLGGYIDILVDFVVYALIPAALVLAAPSPARLWALVFLLMTYYVNTASWMYLSSILEKRQHGAKQMAEKTTITMPPALIGGVETIVYYALFIIWPSQLVLWYTIVGVLLLVSVAQRLLWAVRHLD